MLWVKLHSKFLEWEWHDSPETVSLFIHLIVLANTEDKKWHGMTIERGQLVTSVDKLKGYTGLTTKQVRTCLERLKKTEEVAIKTTNKYSIVTICNYGSYQDKDSNEGQANGQTKDKQRANKGQQLKSNRIEKEKGILRIPTKKETDFPDDIPVFDEILPSTPTPSPVTPEEFAELWNEGRGNCPAVLKLSESRKTKAKARIAEFGKTRDEQLTTIGAIMRGIHESHFLQYEWKCNFEWLITNSDNWMKILEGNYRDKEKKGRMDRFEDDMNYIHNFFHGTQDDKSDSTPDEQ